jgi:hypothetical protein
MSESDDSICDSPIPSEVQILQTSNDRLQRENSQLRDDLLSATERANRLTETIRTLTIESRSTQEENEDMKQRLALVEQMRSDAAAAVVSTQQEEAMIRLQAVSELKQVIAARTHEVETLKSELSIAREEGRRHAEDAFTSQGRLNDIISRSSIAFNVPLNSLDELFAFLDTTPRETAQRSLDDQLAQERESVLVHHVRRLKSKLRTAKRELFAESEIIAGLQSDAEVQKAECEREIVGLSREVKSLRKLHERKAFRAEIEARNAQLSQPLPRLFLCRLPPTSIAPVKRENSATDKFRQKLRVKKVQIRGLLEQEAALRDEISRLNHRNSDLESEVSSLSDRVRTSDIAYSDSQQQLSFLRSTLEPNRRENRHESQLKRAKRRAETASQSVEAYRHQVEDLTQSLQKAQDRIIQLTFQLQKVHAEERSPPPPATVITKIESAPPPDLQRIGYRDVHTDEVPPECEPDLRQIAGNESLQCASKMRATIRVLCGYYQPLLSDLQSRLSASEETLAKMRAAFTDFIPKLSILLTNQRIQLDEFIEKPKAKVTLLNALKMACQPCQALGHPLKLDEPRTAHRTSTRAAKIRDFSSTPVGSEFTIQHPSHRHFQREPIEDLPSDIGAVTRLHREVDHSNEYEEVIAQLKKRCADQRQTIHRLSRQISSAVPT